MAHKIEMSLDDIIELEHPMRDENRRRSGPRQHARHGTSGNGEVQPRRGSSGVLKGHNRGGIQRSRRGDTNGTWKYDMYREPSRSRVPAVAGFGGNSKLIVSNLASNVVESDINELFEEMGPLKSIQMHYDPIGRSLGAAVVVFARQDDAVKAMEQYNGVPMDGRHTRIELATSNNPPSSSRQGGVSAGSRLYRNHRNNGPLRGDYRTNRRGGGHQMNHRSTGGSQRQHRDAKTAEELDAELDEYRNSVE